MLRFQQVTHFLPSPVMTIIRDIGFGPENHLLPLALFTTCNKRELHWAIPTLCLYFKYGNDFRPLTVSPSPFRAQQKMRNDVLYKHRGSPRCAWQNDRHQSSWLGTPQGRMISQILEASLVGILEGNPKSIFMPEILTRFSDRPLYGRQIFPLFVPSY